MIYSILTEVNEYFKIEWLIDKKTQPIKVEFLSNKQNIFFDLRIFFNVDCLGCSYQYHSF